MFKLLSTVSLAKQNFVEQLMKNGADPTIPDFKGSFPSFHNQDDLSNIVEGTFLIAKLT